MKVAMLLPVYRTPWHMLKFVVESVLAQTHEDTKLIVYRDGGPRCPELEGRDDLLYVESDVNLNRGGARNKLIELVGDDVDLIGWIDSDNALAPRHVEYAVEAWRPEYHFVRLRKQLIRKFDYRSTRAIAACLMLYKTPEVLVEKHGFAEKEMAAGPMWTVPSLFLPTWLAKAVPPFETTDEWEDNRWLSVLRALLKARYGQIHGRDVMQPIDGCYIDTDWTNVGAKYQEERESKNECK